MRREQPLNENAMNATDIRLTMEHFKSSHEEANTAALDWCKLLGIDPGEWSRWADFTPLIEKLKKQAESDRRYVREVEAENAKLREEKETLTRCLTVAMEAIENHTPGTIERLLKRAEANSLT